VTIPKDARDLFDRLLPAGLLRDPDRARTLDAIFCFKLAGDGGGDWTIDCSRDSFPPSCAPGVPIKAHCVIEMSAADFQLFLHDPNVGMQLFFQNRLRISGDPKYTSKISAIFELALPPIAAGDATDRDN
jgi:hypothetical protein